MTDYFSVKNNFRQKCLISGLLLSVSIIGGCAVEAAKSDESKVKTPEIHTVYAEKSDSGESKISFETNSPADTIRVFYNKLRERRFREAIFLTNLRPAIEGLTDVEIKDLEVDFTMLAQTVPAEIQINGEIITNDKATVTAKLPNEESGKLELKEFKLRRENGGWMILLVEREAETAVKKEGKNYFFALRMDVHQSEAEKMMRRIAKAQMVYAMQNGGVFAETKSLIEKGFLPADIEKNALTGYLYEIQLASDKKSYKATAEPEVYNKTGRLSYFFEVGAANQNSPLKSADTGGKKIKS